MDSLRPNESMKHEKVEHACPCSSPQQIEAFTTEWCSGHIRLVSFPHKLPLNPSPGCSQSILVDWVSEMFVFNGRVTD